MLYGHNVIMVRVKGEDYNKPSSVKLQTSKY